MMHGFTVGPVQPQCTHTHTHAHRLFHLTVWLDVSFALPVRVWKKITLLSLLCLEMLQFMTFKIHHSLTSSLVLQNCNSWSCFNIWKCPHVSSHACETDIEWVGGGLDKVTICLLFLTQHQLEPPQIITQSWVTRMCQHVLQKVVYTSTAALLTHSLTLVNTHRCCLLPTHLSFKKATFLSWFKWENKTCFCHSAFCLIPCAHIASVSSLLCLHSLILFVSFLLSDAAVSLLSVGGPVNRLLPLSLLPSKDFKWSLFA